MKLRPSLLAVLVLFPAVSRAQSISGVETRITTNLSDQFDPAISGNVMVYTDMRGFDADVWYYDLATGAERPVSTAPGDQQLTDVSDGVVVYTDLARMHVLAFDVATGTTRDLNQGLTSLAFDPAVGQGLVAWQDNRDGNYEIYARELATGVERRITDTAERDERPSVGGGIVAWDRCDTTGLCAVWTYEWATGVSRRLTDPAVGDARAPDVAGGTVAYEGTRGGEKDVFVFDLATGTERRLSLAGNQGNPNVSGDFVAFDDMSSGMYHVRLWHLPSGAVFDVAVQPASQQFLNDLDGNRVVYTDDRNGQLDIFLYEFTVVLPGSGGIADCDHAAGASPLFAATLDRRRGAPTVYDFTVPGSGPVVACIENGVEGKRHLTSGWVWLDGDVLVGPDGWRADCGRDDGDDDDGGRHGRHDEHERHSRHHARYSSRDDDCPARDLIEARGSVTGASHLRARLAGPVGARIRVSLYAASPSPGSAH